MDLICHERLTADNRFAERDTVIFDDMRVLKNLLSSEIRYLPRSNYFANIQRDIKPFMRKVVTVWMLEVCDEQNCENQVFPLAVNFMDRFLCECSVLRCQLQLLSAVCLLLASKVRQCNALTVELLCFYSDHSITPHDIKGWEMLVLSKLQWRMTAITGSEIVNHVLERMTWSRGKQQIRRHAHTLLSLCYTELDFMLMRSSLLASASILAAANGLKVVDWENGLKSICSLTDCCEDDVAKTATIIEQLISAQCSTEQHQLPTVHNTSTTDAAISQTNSPLSPPTPLPPKVLTPPNPPSPTTQPGTPTDIQEILF
ncbi:G1/S-specific cyclin-D2-like [Lycorma delicatula]|uniref:G1/S-specific cyclin-D2-like n=1 Tax=Lycorma delicatula TaxID=130591 RepID=UPI003F51A0D0